MVSFTYKESLRATNPKAWYVATQFDAILNDLLCSDTIQAGKEKWNQIRHNLPDPFYVKLNNAIHKPPQELTVATVKHEMQKYLDYLLK